MYITQTLTGVLGGADAVNHHLLLWGWHGGQGRYNKLSQSETGYIFVEQEYDYCWALSIPNLYLKDFFRAMYIFQTKKFGTSNTSQMSKAYILFVYKCILIWIWLNYTNTKQTKELFIPSSLNKFHFPNNFLLSIATFRDTQTYFSMDTGSGVPCRRTVMTLEMVLMVAGVNWLSFRMWSNRPTIPRSRISWKLLLWSLQ